MQIEYETDLYHWGIKGMKWRKNRPNSHKKKVTSGSGNTKRRGSGLGSKQPLGRRTVNTKYAAKNSRYTKRVLGR